MSPVTTQEVLNALAQDAAFTVAEIRKQIRDDRGDRWGEGPLLPFELLADLMRIGAIVRREIRIKPHGKVVMEYALP